jgi:hypothetical protein
MPAARAFRESESHISAKPRGCNALGTSSRPVEYRAPATSYFSVSCRPHSVRESARGLIVSASFSNVCASPLPPSPVFSCVCAIIGGRGVYTSPLQQTKGTFLPPLSCLATLQHPTRMHVFCAPIQSGLTLSESAATDESKRPSVSPSAGHCTLVTGHFPPRAVSSRPPGED